MSNNAHNVTAITIRTDGREYRPPVPPHRYQGMRLIKHDANINQNSALNVCLRKIFQINYYCDVINENIFLI